MFSFDYTNAKGRDAMDGMLRSYADMTRHIQAIATETAEFSKKLCMDGVAHAEAVSSVTSADEAFELQAAYLRTSYETGISEVTRISEMYVDLARIAFKPFEMPVPPADLQSPNALAKATPAVHAA